MTTQDTLDHDSYDATVEQPTASILDRPVASVDAAPPTSEPPSRRHWFGWVLVIAALVAAAALAVSLLGGSDPSAPVGDAKDHPGYGQVTPVVAAPLGDAKDHAGYGQVTPIAPRTRDDIVRDLVARGVVPAATLDDGTRITSRSLEP